MQVANCHVRLAGDITNEVFKACVTPAEVLVLRKIHGPDAVVKFEPVKQDKRPHAGEFERLKLTYSEKVVVEVFPGSMPNLPVNFKDIGIDLYAEGKATRARKADVVSAGPDAEDDGDDNQE
jgi:hypothetical protein